MLSLCTVALLLFTNTVHSNHLCRTDCLLSTSWDGVSHASNGELEQNSALLPNNVLAATDPSGCGLRLLLQSDSNVVLETEDYQVIWSSGTQGQGATAFVMQADGNLVLYRNSAPLWATGTNYGGQYGPYRLVLLANHNLVIYNGREDMIWASTTGLYECAAPCDDSVCVSPTQCQSLSQVGGFKCSSCPLGYLGNGFVGCTACGLSGCSSYQSGLVQCDCAICDPGFVSSNYSCFPCDVAHCSQYSTDCLCNGCNSGYEAYNGSCHDVNECAVGNGGCDSLTNCTNTLGSRDCTQCPQSSRNGAEGCSATEVPIHIVVAVIVSAVVAVILCCLVYHRRGIEHRFQACQEERTRARTRTDETQQKDKAKRKDEQKLEKVVAQLQQQVTENERLIEEIKQQEGIDEKAGKQVIRAPGGIAVESSFLPSASL